MKTRIYANDHEGFGGVRLSEYESIDTVSFLAQAIAEHGSAFAAYWNHCGGEEYCSVDEFQDIYLGTYKSEEDFVEQRWEDDGTLDKLEEMGIRNAYIDFEMVATDEFIDSYFSVIEDYETCHVFSRN